MSRSTLLRLTLVCILLATALVLAQVAGAQTAKPQCDLEAIIKHQNEHAQELANFAEEAKVNQDVALATLYRTAIAYQALAVECGFAAGDAVEAAHELEHSGLFDSDADTHAHDEAEEAEVLAIARSIGDPDNGKVLFNTFKTEVSFACATCHRVDSTETLVGPGLLGISGHSHDHSEGASTGTTDATHDDHSDDHESTPDAMSGMDMGGATATPDAMSGMNMGEATAEATAEHEQTLAEKVEFLRTSITNPSAFVMTGFPDNLMPKVYGTIFTEQEINDLIAYLFTLD